jgi:hypothetical protein
VSGGGRGIVDLEQLAGPGVTAGLAAAVAAHRVLPGGLLEAVQGAVAVAELGVHLGQRLADRRVGVVGVVDPLELEPRGRRIAQLGGQNPGYTNGVASALGAVRGALHAGPVQAHEIVPATLLAVAFDQGLGGLDVGRPVHQHALVEGGGLARRERAQQAGRGQRRAQGRVVVAAGVLGHGAEPGGGFGRVALGHGDGAEGGVGLEVLGPASQDLAGQLDGVDEQIRA